MKEVRNCEIQCETRGTGSDGSNLVLTGNPVVYESPTTINGPAGPFSEIIRRGALDGADLSDVRLCYNHDLNRVPLARTPKTMTLEKTPAGLSMRANLPDTPEARSIHTAVQRGDLSGMSFAFVVPEGGDTYDPVTNTRSIYKISKVLECSVVPFPAYQEASVEARTAIQKANDRKQAISACDDILKQGKQRSIIGCNQILVDVEV